MKWLKKLFAVEQLDIAPSDLSVRVAEIQQRIATLKHSISGPEKSSASTLPQQPNNDVQASKVAELDDLKAKLLGKKS